MKRLTLLVLLVIIIGFQACKKDEVEVEPQLKEIQVGRSTVMDITTFWWSKVEDISWYFIYFGKAGEDKQEYNTENSGNNTYSFVITDLSANTSYEAIVKGKDKETNGTVVAESKTITFTTGTY